jgi:CHAT domain-containing protein
LRLWLEAPELQALPWELLYDAEQDEFLAHSGRVLITRYMTVRRGAPPLKVKPPLSILIASAAPEEQPKLNVEAEIEVIQTALAPLEDEKLVRVAVLPHAQRFTLRAALRDHDPYVLHFVGHGNIGPKGGVLILETAEGRSDPLTGSMLASLLKRTKVRLAVINACLSARGAPLEASQFDDQRRAVLGVGPALVRAGLGAVVANQFSAVDQQARLFAEDFYGTLARFEPVDEAVSRAREALMLGSGEDSRDWATPVLFLRSRDGIIFERS